MRIKTANWFVRFILKARGFKAVTYPWGTYVLPGEEHNTGLIAHEMVHVEQAQRMGAAWYLIKYFLLFLRYGYENHPMEIEAREKSGFR